MFPALDLQILVAGLGGGFTCLFDLLARIEARRHDCTRCRRWFCKGKALLGGVKKTYLHAPPTVSSPTPTRPWCLSILTWLTSLMRRRALLRTILSANKLMTMTHQRATTRMVSAV
ncbi:hypothetical protein DL93DRAFT_1793442 [Clavulina sp. PMI_390]|nr:hypothetical protein DL93DRAFT_1793442 [Clavulina sp. PMI_390]